jgi:hypothetical protein
VTSGAAKSPPPDTIPSEEFYAQDERRRHSHVLSYGSAWRDGAWTDDNHVIEIMWLGATHEIVSFYITYDWSRLAPGQMTRDAALAAGLELGADAGIGVGRMLADADLATADVHVRLLGLVGSDLECHELLWDWRWVQHHSDGYAHIVERIRAHNRRHNPT